MILTHRDHFKPVLRLFYLGNYGIWIVKIPIAHNFHHIYITSMEIINMCIHTLLIQLHIFRQMEPESHWYPVYFLILKCLHQALCLCHTFLQFSVLIIYITTYTAAGSHICLSKSIRHMV